MVRLLLFAGGLVVVSWAVLVVLARRLPPGAATALATVLQACVTTVKRLRRDQRVPRRAEVVVALAGLWVLSPIDLIPEFIPVSAPSTTCSLSPWCSATPPGTSHSTSFRGVACRAPNPRAGNTDAPRTPIEVSQLGASTLSPRINAVAGRQRLCGRVNACRFRRSRAGNVWVCE